MSMAATGNNNIALVLLKTDALSDSLSNVIYFEFEFYLKRETISNEIPFSYSSAATHKIFTLTHSHAGVDLCPTYVI